MDIVKVETTADFRLLLDYEDGQRRVFDMRPLLNERPWNQLMSENTFHEARVEFGTVVWPGRVDIAPETLLVDSVPLAQVGASPISG